MKTLVLAACLAAGVVAQEPTTKPTELEKLRQEVAAQRQELEELQETKQLQEEVTHLKRDLVKAEHGRLHPADLASLKAEVVKLRATLAELAVMARLQREAAALKRRLAWERLSPKAKKKALVKRERRRQKILTDINKRYGKITDNDDEIKACEKYIVWIRKTRHTYKGQHIRSKKAQIKNCKRKIAADQKKIRELQADLVEFNDHPGGEVQAQPAAQAAGVVDQAALNLRPSWLHRNITTGFVVPARAPDGTWWAIHSRGGDLFSLHEFGKGNKARSKAIAWAEKESPR